MLGKLLQFPVNKATGYLFVKTSSVLYMVTATAIPCRSGKGRFPVFMAASSAGFSCVMNGSSC